VADLDDLPLPVYDPEIYPSMRGDEKIRIIVVDDSRGCRNHCAFCFHPVKSSHRLRVKSIPRLMREVDSFERGLGIRTFRFAGSCTPYSLLNGFAAEVRRTGRKLAYTSFAHVRGIAEADLQALRQSGCLALFFGIESGSQRILDLMRKGVHTEMIAEALRKAKEAGIFTVGSLIYPAPGETEATAAESLALLARERPDALSIQAPIVIPRTDWCEHPEAYGIAFRNRDHYLAAGLRWKLNLLLPPMFWQDLPVRIDGRTYKQVLRETGRLVREAERLGFVTGASDDLYLMSVRSGMDLPAFRDASRPAFFAGDTPAVRALVPRINASV
jgi:radical SAM superfamily enzyme YgiQ (UPF0313 family)